MVTKVVGSKDIKKTQTHEPVAHKIQGQIGGRVIEKAPRSAKIQFNFHYLTKEETPSKYNRGSLAITRDDKHTGWLHHLIHLGQIINSKIFGTPNKNINLCHSQVIIGVNERKGKEGELLLAHAIFGGIKTTSESHKKDEVITGVNIYRPVDEKMRNLFAKFAEQTAVNFRDAGLNPKAKDFKSRVKKEVGQFSIPQMIYSIFHCQVVKPQEKFQERAAYAAADLLRGDKLRNEKGNLAAYFCSAYTMTLLQGTALVSALNYREQKLLKEKSRDVIAHHLLGRIQAKSYGDRVAATYWENEFMQLDASRTMSYIAGDVLDRACVTEKA